MTAALRTACSRNGGGGDDAVCADVTTATLARCGGDESPVTRPHVQPRLPPLATTAVSSAAAQHAHALARRALRPPPLPTMHRNGAHTASRSLAFALCDGTTGNSNSTNNNNNGSNNGKMLARASCSMTSSVSCTIDGKSDTSEHSSTGGVSEQSAGSSGSSIAGMSGQGTAATTATTTAALSPSSRRLSFMRLTYALLQRDVMDVPLSRPTSRSCVDGGGCGCCGCSGCEGGGDACAAARGAAAAAMTTTTTNATASLLSLSSSSSCAEHERLARVQQMHHDMAIIHNGGREVVTPGLRSSVDLASALSRLRARKSEQQQQQDRRGSKNNSNSDDDDDDDTATKAVQHAVHIAWTATPSALDMQRSLSLSRSTRRDNNNGDADDDVRSAAAATTTTTRGVDVHHRYGSASALPMTSSLSARRVHTRALKGKQLIVHTTPDSDKDEVTMAAEDDDHHDNSSAVRQPHHYHHARYHAVADDSDSDSDDALYSFAQQRKTSVRQCVRGDDGDVRRATTTARAAAAAARATTTTAAATADVACNGAQLSTSLCDGDVAMEELEGTVEAHTTSSTVCATQQQSQQQQRTTTSTSDGDEPVLSMCSFRRARAQLRHDNSSSISSNNSCDVSNSDSSNNNSGAL